MDLITGQRTFCVGLSGIANQVITDIPFRDTEGNDIKCNYFKLHASLGGGAAANVGSVVAQVSGISIGGNMVGTGISGVGGTLEGSGICGVGVMTAHDAVGEATWHGSNGQVCTGIQVQTQLNGGTMSLLVTYGNLFPLNTIRTTNSLIYDAGV